MLGLVRQHGLGGTFLYLLEKTHGLRVPVSSSTRWHASKKTEVNFWDHFFEQKGADWKDDYAYRLDPKAEVSPDVRELLADLKTLNVLDVGAGPPTVLGKYCDGRKLNLKAVDPLAVDYDRIMGKYGVEPVVRTEEMAAERLSAELPKDHFDLVFAQNCIDHSIDPLTSILEMVKVARPGGYIYLKHSQNEAVKENWYGLHQWNLSEDRGDFIISSRDKSVNFSREYGHLGDIECTVDPALDYVLLKIRKAEAADQPAEAASEQVA